MVLLSGHKVDMLSHNEREMRGRVTENNRQFAVFLIVGAVSTAVHYVVLLLLVETASVNPVPASIFGYLIGGAVNYVLNYSHTFASKKKHLSSGPRFAIVAAIGFFINGGVMWILTVAIGFYYLLAQIFATGVVLLWNFNANRRWTF